jgi:hypothetical protein
LGLTLGYFFSSGYHFKGISGKNLEIFVIREDISMKNVLNIGITQKDGERKDLINEMTVRWGGEENEAGSILRLTWPHLFLTPARPRLLGGIRQALQSAQKEGCRGLIALFLGALPSQMHRLSLGFII